MTRVRLSPSASVTTTEVGVLLRSDLGTFQLDGHDVKLFVNEILPLLDGTRDKEAVASALEEFSRQSVVAFLDLLEQYGLLETVPAVPEAPEEQDRWRGQKGFFQKWTDQPEEAARRLGEARVLIVGLEPWGAVAATELAAAGVGALHLLDDGQVASDDLESVRAWGSEHLGRPRSQALMEGLSETAPWCRVTRSMLTVAEDRRLILDDTNWDLVIGATAADDLLLLRSLARFAHEAKVVSLLGHLEGINAFVGPVVVPGKTACWNCSRLRQLANAEHPQAAHALQASLLVERPQPRRRTYLTPMAAVLGHFLALEALKLISHYTPSTLIGRLLVQNLVTLETTLHTVVRMPWCEVCGGASDGGTLPGGPVGGENEESERKGGQGRLDAVREPGELRKLLAGWVDERTGVIRHLIMGSPEATEPELPLMSSAVLASYTEGKYQPEQPEIGSGKGLSSIEAMVGAAGEAIERYSASRYRKDDMFRASLNDLQADALDPRRLCLYDETQYDEPGFPFARFDPDLPIEWTTGHWLDSGKKVWVPALPTYFNFRVRPQELFCQVSSNGLAAGADLEDASLRAIFELVERDAFVITWLSQRTGRKVVLDDSLDVRVHEVVRQLEERGASIELYLLDAGIFIPTVACLGFGDGQRWPGVTVALGAHLNLHTAVRKAILEQGHVGPYIRRLMLSGEHSIPARPEEVRTLTDHALYYAPAERAQVLNFLRSSEDPTFLAEMEEAQDVSLRSCVERLTAANIRVAIADVTSPDIAASPFRVVRALGTDIQQIHFGFKLRRLANPRLKAMINHGLNPHPHPLA